jgi:tripartite-type tricarboxylate transporter receptor subunit TctC
MKKRELVVAALGILFISTCCPSANALIGQGQTVTINVGFAAGGAADIVARLLSSRLSEKLGGASVVIENRVGASGEIAARLVANSEPNGTTILATTTAVAVSETLSKNKGYAAQDLRAVSIAAWTPDSLVINAANPAMTLNEFIARAKGKSISFGSAGVGTSTFVAAAYFFKKYTNIDAVHVPFPGGAPALNSLMGGHIDAVAITLPTIVPFVRAGKLRGIAIASGERLKDLPDLPTYQESGYTGFTSSTWVGFFVSSKTKDDVAAKINAAFNAVLQEPEIRARLREIGFEPNPTPLSEANAQFKSEVEAWRERIQAIGMDVH